MEANIVEVRKTINDLKLNKTMGIDGIPNKVWKYKGEEIEKWVVGNM